MVRKNIFILLLLIFVGQVNVSLGQCDVENKSFQSGEAFEFTGYYQLGFIWLNFGKVDVKVSDTIVDKKPAYMIEGSARNAKAYDMFFKLRDTLNTCIAKENLTPLYFDRKTHEGSYNARHVYKYDNTNKKIHAYIKKNKGETQHKVVDFEGCVNNLLSTLFYVRNIDYDKYKSGTDIPVQLIVDGEISKVFVRYHGVEKIKAKNCPRVQCYKITPVMPKGAMFESGEGMYIWLTKDANRVPLMLEADIPVGSVKGILRKYHKLKNTENVLNRTSGIVKR